MHGSDQKHESIHVWPPGSYGIAGECCSDTEQSVEEKIQVVFSPSFNITLTSQRPSTHHLQHLDPVDQCFSTLTVSSFCSVLVPIPQNIFHFSYFHDLNSDNSISRFNPSKKNYKNCSPLKEDNVQRPPEMWQNQNLHWHSHHSFHTKSAGHWRQCWKAQTNKVIRKNLKETNSSI